MFKGLIILPQKNPAAGSQSSQDNSHFASKNFGCDS